MRRIVLVITTLIVGLAGASLAAKETAVTSPPAADVMNMIREGGYVIFLRHSTTRMDLRDGDHDKLDDCTVQRNLSEEGRTQARQIGAAFRAAGTPIGAVYAGPYCRTKDTAEIAFGRFEVADSLRHFVGAPLAIKPGIVAGTRELLGRRPASGTNTVLVSHNSNLEEAANIWPAEQGVAIVFKPSGDGRFVTVGKIEPSEWPLLAAE
ncbi:MAG: histidine phosphatase family protein [Proteobacteria bacterium]|nr:histidine phosphatase family protein [Pseudomonadota bacterium]